MARMAATTALLLLAAAPAAARWGGWGRFAGWGYEERVLPQDIRQLVLYAGRMTASRRSAPAPQVSCDGGLCREVAIEYVECENTLTWNEPKWKCTVYPEMHSALTLYDVDVNCEGYDHRNDRYVLQGSCGVRFRIKERPGWRRHGAGWRHAPHGGGPISGGYGGGGYGGGGYGAGGHGAGGHGGGGTQDHGIGGFLGGVLGANAVNLLNFLVGGARQGHGHGYGAGGYGAGGHGAGGGGYGSGGYFGGGGFGYGRPQQPYSIWYGIQRMLYNGLWWVIALACVGVLARFVWGMHPRRPAGGGRPPSAFGFGRGFAPGPGGHPGGAAHRGGGNGRWSEDNET